MKNREDSQNVSLLIRDGAGVSIILRIKSSLRLSDQKDNKLVKIGLDDRIPQSIGYLARTFIAVIRREVPDVRIIGFRKHQVILNLCLGENGKRTNCTEEQEKKVVEIMDSLITSKGFIPRWSVKRQVGDDPKPMR